MPKPLPAGIYGITAEKFSNGRSNIEVVREMIRGGVSVVQYREKYADKRIRSIYEECQAIREMTAEHGVMFIINDFVDIALLVDADGVHVGQDDLPVSAVRQMVGDKLIGLSTHSPEEAEGALAIGADYIGVGPIFETQTKHDAGAPIGLDFLAHAVRHVSIPVAAIGGIKADNLEAVCRQGAITVCMVTDIVGAPDIARKVESLRKIMDRAR